ncbi:sugar phosphate isomerase/epimerase [Glaciimonas sp. PAMC28666]|uniref:sugar phosphate isomerase/epimerase family protein n=1 Tax=Glaciimonas sp. PAMC28666 TaxID=2807626 RepID=UPI001964817F|nr:sugar phosphate isomerase/epimerase family protein [Glaciimonas sp. PAMC28666]QRX81710.1 sugar phosphate isomerase/epimerase [Glaciimonas sp. PAMC28666]
MDTRIISISAAPYDGYVFPKVLESLASCGARYVEPAFIVGYTEPFDETAFTPAQAQLYANWLTQSGIGCYAFSSHIDLGGPDAVKVFTGRMDFAAHLGARVINTNAAARSNSASFFKNIEVLARHAEQLDMIIGLENPGDGSDNLFNTAQDGITLLAQIGHPRVRLNYDAGNTISHRPPHQPHGVNPANDALLAMPGCGYTHIKDVRVTNDGYFFVPLGEGDIDCAAILSAVAQTSLNLSIEMPLRLHRASNAQPRRNSQPVPLVELETAIKSALDFVKRNLGSQPAGVAA